MGASLSSRRAGVRSIASGRGWRIRDILCASGPLDTPFEEQHEWVSVSAVIGGTFNYRSTHGRTVLAAGSILLGNAGACFCCSHEHGIGDRCVAFQFEADAFEDVARATSEVRRATFTSHRIPPTDALVPLLVEAKAITRGEGDRAEDLAWRVAGAALRLHCDAPEREPTAREAWRVSEVARHIEGHPGEAHDLESLAARSSMSRFHFLRVFRSVLGATPYKYVLTRRLTLAAEQLCITDKSVLCVALECGFGDLSEFTRRFKARFGRSPGVYRMSRR